MKANRNEIISGCICFFGIIVSIIGIALIKAKMNTINMGLIITLVVNVIYIVRNIRGDFKDPNRSNKEERR